MVAFYIRRTTKILVSIVLTLFFQEVTSQVVDCDQLFNEDEWEITGTPEVMAIPYGGLELFYEKLKNEVNDTDERGKIFVRFAVDTLGGIHCAKVVKSDNELLNMKALEIIERTKFTPAMNRGKKIISPMVLPITFGEPPKKKKEKK